MVKLVTQWLRGLTRAGKAQQRSANRLVKDLLGKPPRKSRATAKLKPKLAAAPKAVAKPKAAPAPPPGKWLTSYYTDPPEAGALSGRRISYWLYLPARAPSEAVRLKGLSLVVMLHDCQQSAPEFAQGTRLTSSPR